ncbi:adenylate/guanylate cyclase domain-containing protein [Thiovibrio sp. JS02]
MLLVRKLLTQEQLQRALALQMENNRKFGQNRCLGRILVDQGVVSEAEIVAAINAFYGLRIHSLADNLETLIHGKRKSLLEHLLSPRITIGAQLFITFTLIILLVTFLFGSVMIERQRKQLYAQSVLLGTVSLNYFNNNARIPLLENNILALNTLIRGATAVDGHLYAMILDNAGRIMAHTDHRLIGTRFSGHPGREEKMAAGEITYFNYRDPEGGYVLNLLAPVIFQDKVLGQVHVGLSIDFIEQLVKKGRKVILLLSLAIILVAGLMATLLGIRLTRPVKGLLRATREIAAGNYKHTVDLGRNDEFQDLAVAFNQMSGQLWLKAMIQESFGKYVGVQVLDLIIAQPERHWVKGCREEATILFADIRGFTAYAEATAPEEVVEGLNEFFEIATQTVHAHGGYVDKFIGDAVLAVFGVPASREDHVGRATRAALAMQRRYRELAGSGHPLLGAVGIGLNSGPVVAGNIGSQAKMEYTVIGDTVNVAARLNGQAASGEVLISDYMYERLAGHIESEALPPRQIKGKAKPMVIHRVFSWHDDDTVS